MKKLLVSVILLSVVAASLSSCGMRGWYRIAKFFEEEETAIEVKDYSYLPDSSKGLELVLVDEYTCPTYSVVGMGQCNDTDIVLGRAGDYAISRFSETAFANNSNITSVYLCDTISSVMPRAFQNCSSLRSVTLPDTLTYLGWSAFEGCGALETIALGEGIDIIKTDTFQNCGGLKSVTIKCAELKEIEASAFAFCTSLEDIYFAGTMEQWEAVEKEGTWNWRANEFVVHCSDGDIGNGISGGLGGLVKPTH